MHDVTHAAWLALVRSAQRTVLLGLAAGTGVAAAGPAQCYEDPRTNAMQCVSQAEVREKAGIRIAPLYTGGPNGVRKTSFTIHTNCATGVTHLKDRDGVSFAGGNGNETAALRMLRRLLCEASLKSSR